MKTLSLFSAFLVMLAISGNGCSQTSPQDKTVNVEDNDSEMTAAIAKARATLSEFWKKFEHPGRNESDFSLKVRITDKNGVEHFWLGNLQAEMAKSMAS